MACPPQSKRDAATGIARRPGYQGETADLCQTPTGCMAPPITLPPQVDPGSGLRDHHSSKMPSTEWWDWPIGHSFDLKMPIIPIRSNCVGVFFSGAWKNFSVALLYSTHLHQARSGSRLVQRVKAAEQSIVSRATRSLTFGGAGSHCRQADKPRRFGPMYRLRAGGSSTRGRPHQL